MNVKVDEIALILSLGVLTILPACCPAGKKYSLIYTPMLRSISIRTIFVLLLVNCIIIT